MTRLLHSPLVRFLRKSAFLYFGKQIPRMAACLAYFLLLTVFPLLICVNAFLGLLNLNTSDLLVYLGVIFPEMSLGMVSSYLSYISLNQSGALLAAGLIMTVISSSAAYRILVRVMADIYGRSPRGGIRNLLVSILFPLAFLLTIYLSICVIVTGEWFLGMLSQRFVLGATLLSWSWMRFVLLFGVFLLFITGIYNGAAPKGVPRLPLYIAGILSSIALVAASILFSWFIGMSTRYSLVYGSLVSLIVLLVWLYLCGNILLLGNVFSFVWYRDFSRFNKSDWRISSEK